MTADRIEPKFSVVLPTHNRADVLPFAIHSALRQTDDRFELLIAGDGCTDSTAAVVRSFDDPRIHWFDLPKAPGVGYAGRNVALRHARGRYIAYLSHDDIWFPDHLERIGRALDDTGADLVHSRLLLVDLEGNLRPFAYNLEVPSHRQDLARGRTAISVTCVAHTRACLDRAGGWNEQILRGGDIELWYRIARQGHARSLVFVSDPTSLHFVASWRNATQAKWRRRVGRRLVDSLSGPVPEALRLAVTGAETQQEAAWRQLSKDPEAYVRAIRQAVISVHDAMLWRSQSMAGQMGFKAGASLGTFVDRIWTRALRLTSADLRRWDRDMRRTEQHGPTGWDARAPGGGTR